MSQQTLIGALIVVTIALYLGAWRLVVLAFVHAIGFAMVYFLGIGLMAALLAFQGAQAEGLIAAIRAFAYAALLYPALVVIHGDNAIGRWLRDAIPGYFGLSRDAD